MPVITEVVTRMLFAPINREDSRVRASLTTSATDSDARVGVCLFRLDALELSVIATATWLAGWVAGWLGGWLSHSGIVSKRLNLSENISTI